MNILMPLVSSSRRPLVTRTAPLPSLAEFGNRLLEGARFRPRSLNATVEEALRYWRDHDHTLIGGVVLTFAIPCDFNVIHSLLRSIRQKQSDWNDANRAAEPCVPLVVVARGVPTEVWDVGVGEPNSVVVHVVNSIAAADFVLGHVLFG